jgi:glycosyltransferase involved in cell wall biosynthesis
MSIVAIEAGITGTPVLMTDVCGFRHVETINGGLIVKPEITAIGEGLQTLLEDREKSKQCGQRLKDYVLANFTWDSIIVKYIYVFRTISASSQ